MNKDYYVDIIVNGKSRFPDNEFVQIAKDEFQLFLQEYGVHGSWEEMTPHGRSKFLWRARNIKSGKTKRRSSKEAA
jgi:hypothetical protein